MVLNPGKCHFMCMGKLNFNDLILKNCTEVEILGTTLDPNLNFRSHIKKL